MPLDPSLVLPTVLAATTTGGGIWFVVKLVIRYQHDFTDRYAARITWLDKRLTDRDHRIDELEKRIQQLERALMAAEYERAALRSIVVQHGIPWEPVDWGAIRHDNG